MHLVLFFLHCLFTQAWAKSSTYTTISTIPININIVMAATLSTFTLSEKVSSTTMTQAESNIIDK